MSLILAANFIAEKRFEFLGNYFPEVDVQAKLDDVETNYFPDPTIELWGSSRPEGVKLMTAHLLTIDMMNAAQVDLGHLAGRNERKYEYSNWGQQWSAVSRKVEWLVRADAPVAAVTIVAASQKGGTDRRTASLS